MLTTKIKFQIFSHFEMTAHRTTSTNWPVHELSSAYF